jgi:putative transposase
LESVINRDSALFLTFSPCLSYYYLHAKGRFFSCVLDEIHLLAAMGYVENNPVRAGIVEKAEDYRWSSAAGHIGRNEDAVVSKDCPVVGSTTDWATYLEQRDDQLMKTLRGSTKNGRP